MRERLDILKCTICVTRENEDKLTELPNFPKVFKPGDIIEYGYSIYWDSDLELTHIPDEEYQALIWAISTYPTVVDFAARDLLKAHMKKTSEQMKLLTYRLDELIEAI